MNVYGLNYKNKQENNFQVTINCVLTHVFRDTFVRVLGKPHIFISEEIDL